VPAADHPTGDSVHQTGTRYSSNNAGDGPEKTRDCKAGSRFKANWLGTFRSKQMFQCCECAVVAPANGSSLSSQAGRYKGAEGKHCRCGEWQWHLAKSNRPHGEEELQGGPHRGRCKLQDLLTTTIAGRRFASREGQARCCPASCANLTSPLDRP
jgi:hypothetical protein